MEVFLMVPSLLKELSEEKVVLLNSSAVSRLPFPVDRVVRLVDTKGNTIGLLLDKETLEEMGEEVDALAPSFLSSLEHSRKSGRIAGVKVKRKIAKR
jgi:hypothetical protein